MQYCSEKDKEKARLIPYGDKGRGGIQKGEVVNRFSLERGIQGNHVFPALPGGVALPSEDDLTCCVQEIGDGNTCSGEPETQAAV